MLLQEGCASNVDAWNGNALPLEECAKLVTTDIDAVHAHMSSVFCRHHLHIEGGVPPILFRHHQTSLRSLTFNATDYGNPYGRIVVGIPPMEHIYLVQFSLSGLAAITQGDQTHLLRPGEMCVLGSDSRIRQTFAEGYRHFTVKIPKSDLQALLVRELGFRPGELIFSPRPVPVEGIAATFTNMVRLVCDDLNRGLPGYDHPRVGEAIEDTLKRLLLAAVPHNHSDLFDGPTPGPAPYYVRRVEEYVRAHAEDPISLTDLIDVSGVSARSLHTGFRRFRDATPMGYLKNYRLARARAALRGGAESGLSVTQVALNCGFTHLSKFAHDYYERYGERPSETLRSA
ncbi:AraC family transcriptional regulator [Sphingobium terrigena]|uniref:AraC family transcriptional regulator n=2 Tax=Sphingobium terrigena TaxID=2304063 RepID=A0A418YV37_9SPHN|nr:AraC family transcriptional regulator [Sphingobium terrigena]